MHSLHHYSVDNFDMVFDKLLTLKNLLGDEQRYRPLLNKLICMQLLDQNINTAVQLDSGEPTGIIGYIDDLQFRIAESGVAFIFQKYEIASFADSAIFVTVPYDELKSIISECKQF